MKPATLNVSSAPQIISSRDIAELVASRHADVCRVIERLAGAGAIQGYPPTPYTHPQNGQIYNEYRIGKRDSYVVVAQISPEFTARLVDRWQELESQTQQQFRLPQTMHETLWLVANLAGRFLLVLVLHCSRSTISVSN
ncbi:Rha family transcriptional regulator [Pectobacterium versatile]|uniref:Rha family transcriptional regulator n=1 Tax=Pectobacterium versatile TaxID=2488639 RepID=A0AAW3RYW2_9GAMM|nr:Rha family transcriptional regulator [Pectobacterium versatile]